MHSIKTYFTYEYFVLVLGIAFEFSGFRNNYSNSLTSWTNIAITMVLIYDQRALVGYVRLLQFMAVFFGTSREIALVAATGMIISKCIQLTPAICQESKKDEPVIQASYILVDANNKVEQEMIIAVLLTNKDLPPIYTLPHDHPPKYSFTTNYQSDSGIVLNINRIGPIADIRRQIVEATDMVLPNKQIVCEDTNIDVHGPRAKALQAMIIAPEADATTLIDYLHLICECVVFTTREKAVQHLSTMDVRPHIIMVSLDVDCDKTDNLILMIRRLWDAKRMHIVALAGTSIHNESFQHSIVLEVNSFLLKPFVRSNAVGAILEYSQLNDAGETVKGQNNFVAGKRMSSVSTRQLFNRRMSSVATIICIAGPEVEKRVHDIAMQTGCTFTAVASISSAIQMCHIMPSSSYVIILEMSSFSAAELEELERVRQMDAYNMDALPILVIGSDASIGQYYIFNDYVLNVDQDVEMRIRIERLLVGFRLERGNQFIKRLSLALLNEIIPQRTLLQMQAGRTIIADHHPHIVCCFIDIVGFTARCSELHVSQVVNVLYELYREFDDLTDRHGVFKVETIGDAYFVASWTEEPEVKILKFAKDAVEVARSVFWPNGDCVQVRCGVASGDGMSGTFSCKRPRFCMFGDVVNSAARFQSVSKPMCIAVSESVAKVARTHHIVCEFWKTELLKGKGDVNIWLVATGDWQTHTGCNSVENSLV